MTSLAPRWLFALVAASLAVSLSASAESAPDSPLSWRVKPDYETPVPMSMNTGLSIRDESGVQHNIYSRSTAIMIIEGAYSVGGWQDVSAQGRASETLIRSELEKRGYRVLIWRNLTGLALNMVFEDMVPNIGYDPRGRLFIYYFGHGSVVGTVDDPSGPRGYLVPIDAPDPARDERGFYAKAEPISYLQAYVRQMTTKHVFVALEACRAGSIFDATLGGVPELNPQGYLLSDHVQLNVRQFLTAGDANQDVPASGLFTGVLAQGFSEADTNGDGYVTGSELIAFVAHTLPQRTTTNSLNPEFASVGLGDMIIGPDMNDLHQGPKFKQSPKHGRANASATLVPPRPPPVVVAPATSATQSYMLSVEQQRYLVGALSQLRDKVPRSLILWVTNNSQTLGYANAFQAVFLRAGLQPSLGTENPRGPDETGLMLLVGPDSPMEIVYTVQKILRNTGISARIVERPAYKNYPPIMLFVSLPPL